MTSETRTLFEELKEGFDNYRKLEEEYAIIERLAQTYGYDKSLWWMYKKLQRQWLDMANNFGKIIEGRFPEQEKQKEETK